MKIIAKLSSSLFGLLLLAGAAVAQPTVSASGQSLVVDGVTTENGAILKVAGPGGYRFMQDIAQGTSGTIESLQPGVYRYEVVSRPGGALATGTFQIGSASNSASRTDSVSEEDVGPRASAFDDSVWINDIVNDGVTTLDLDSDGDTDDLHWTLVNELGTLLFKEHDTNSGNGAGTGTTNISFNRANVGGGIGIGTALTLQALDIQTALPSINMYDTDGGTNWKLINDAGRFALSSACIGASCELFERWDVVVVEEGSAENSLVIASSGVSLLSSRTVKKNIQPASSSALLAQLAELPLYTWSYANDSKNSKHVGPMAEDFHNRFGFGSDEKRISPLDTGGLALAGVQALQLELNKRDAEIAELKAAVEILLARAK